MVPRSGVAERKAAHRQAAKGGLSDEKIISGIKENLIKEHHLKRILRRERDYGIGEARRVASVIFEVLKAYDGEKLKEVARYHIENPQSADTLVVTALLHNENTPQAIRGRLISIIEEQSVRGPDEKITNDPAKRTPNSVLLAEEWEESMQISPKWALRKSENPRLLFLDASVADMINQKLRSGSGSKQLERAIINLKVKDPAGLGTMYNGPKLTVNGKAYEVYHTGGDKDFRIDYIMVGKDILIINCRDHQPKAVDYNYLAPKIAKNMERLVSGYDLRFRSST